MNNSVKEPLLSLGSLDDATGGTAILGEEFATNVAINRDYRECVQPFNQYAFWADGSTTYRPQSGLWAPQRKAVALSLAYLSSQRIAGKPKYGVRESCLIKMPTGSGKTGVITTLACCALKVRRTVILTPRTALVEQMMKDLSWRFWKRFGLCYAETSLKARSQYDQKWLEQLDNGKLTFIEGLNEKGYARIWGRRQTERQIIVGTFNALHAVLGIEPPAHRSMQGRQARPPAGVLATCTENAVNDGVENFRALLRDTDLLLVDEGHYEPAFSWAQCVAALDVPTILFSATPYRNDFKYFNVFGNFAFNLSFDEAVKHRLIRDVAYRERGVPPTGASTRSTKKDESLKDFVSFVRDRVEKYGLVPEGRPAKCIVHGATYETLKQLQCEFYRQDHALRAVLIHDAHKGDEKRLNGDLRKLGARAYAALAPYRFEHVSEASDPDGVGLKPRVWLHQFKLLEGIDNADFHEIFLYDGFRSARELIQQVGRALRYSDTDRKVPESASVFGARRRFDRRAGVETVEAVAKRHWENYRAYEDYVAREPARAFTAETQLLSLLKKTAPEWQYIGREFRKGFFTDENATMEEYVLPRRAVICHFRKPDAGRSGSATGPSVLTDTYFDRMARACAEALLLEDRFDIRIVPAPLGADAGFRDVRMIRYLTWANSRNLRQQSVPEWNLGVMAIVRSSPYVFLLDTESLCVDFERLGLFSASPEEMKRLFSDPDAAGSSVRQERIRIVEATSAGLDLSDMGIRSITIRKRDLSDGYFDLAEASQAPSSLHGVAILDDKTTRRQLSIRRGRVADPTTRYIGLMDYLRWTRSVAEALDDSSTVPHPFFRRFAQEVEPPLKEDGEAQNILLDIWGLLNPDDSSLEDRHWDRKVAQEILEFDRCLEAENVAADGDPPDYAFVLGGKYQLRATYTRRNSIPPTGRYTLRCAELDEALVTPQTPSPGTLEVSPFGGGPIDRAASLMALINQDQCFRVIPAADGVVYANGVFFRPSIDWEAIRESAQGNLLEIVEISPSLAPVVSEKGEAGVTSRDWATHSQFGIIVTAFQDRRASTKDPLRSIIAGCDLLVCDDGSSEIGDFICLETSFKRIILIHAKAKDGDAGVSAGNLETVGRQASASLAFVGSSRASLAYPSHWEKKLIIRNRKSKKKIKTIDRVLTRRALSPKEAHAKIVAALKDSTFRREVWVVTAGLLSKRAARAELGDDSRRRGALQFAYYLADLRTAFGRAGVALRVFTAE